MTLYSTLNSITPPRGRLVKVETVAKERIARLQMYRAMQDFLGQTDKDYLNLQKSQKSANSVLKPDETFIEGLKKFLEKGSMF